MMTIGNLHMISYKNQQYCLRVIINDDRDTSLVCQFFLPDGKTLVLKVQFTYNFLLDFNDNLFNFPALYSKKSSVSFDSIRPFVRFSIEKLKEKASGKSQKSLIKISSCEDKDILDAYDSKQCIHFNNDICNISDVNDEAEGRTTEGGCTSCGFPETFERCHNLINGKTKGVIDKGRIVRHYFDPICRKRDGGRA
ncbi:hypothetical protein KAW55_05915 [bacterium]|nr:hypothetical protein [bacterium]